MKKNNFKRSETITRSVIKTITYRIVIIIATYIAAFSITGDQKVSIGITSVTSIANTILYYSHERVWNLIKWGSRG